MYKNRYDAALQMVPLLEKYKNNSKVVIVAIPRGALEIGAVLAKELNAPLDVAFVKKIGAPGNPEFAIGALSMETITVDPMYEHLIEHIQKEVETKRKTLKERVATYYTQDMQPIDLKNKIVILTDDGIATGRTFLEAIKLIKKQNPKKIIAAVPVATPERLEFVRPEVDEIICTLLPNDLYAIGQFFHNFEQVDDKQAIRLLHASRK